MSMRNIVGKHKRLENEEAPTGLPNERKQTRLLVLLGVLVVVAVAAACLAMWLTSSQTSNGSEREHVSATDRSRDIYSRASADPKNTSYEKAMGEFDEVLSETEDSADKVTIYFQKATLALNTKRYDDAIAFAMKADALEPSHRTARLLGVCYVGKGDSAKALAYYEKALSLLEIKNDNDALTAEEYKREIARIKEGA
ncbi:hypothetical protein CSA80_04345 [Candidatus Saccharibacteria bacterium]|nr:MAG: hypothetical protein CR973_01580 [Candidatus Saccharibacteria bacterium]PID98900.1 MAG: hypothetical protein CSA80_04345 [Candidatus Saccharibacteria bacterium]